jgi:hypothetical protein
LLITRGAMYSGPCLELALPVLIKLIVDDDCRKYIFFFGRAVEQRVGARVASVASVATEYLFIALSRSVMLPYKLPLFEVTLYCFELNFSYRLSGSRSKSMCRILVFPSGFASAMLGDSLGEYP